MVVLVCISQMISIVEHLSCARWPSLHLLWKMSIQIPHPFLTGLFGDIYKVVYVLYLFWMLTLYQMYDLQTYSPFSRWPFCFVDGFLCCTKAFWFNIVPPVYFWFCFPGETIPEKILLILMFKNSLPVFSFSSFVVSGLT